MQILSRICVHVQVFEKSFALSAASDTQSGIGFQDSET